MTVPLLPPFAASAQHTVDDFTGRVVCLDALRLLRMLPDASIDMVLTSPPYDNLRTYNGFTWDFEGIAKETYRVLKTGGVLVWVVGDATVNGSETLTSMRQALYFVDVCGFKMHQTVIYEKDAMPFPPMRRYYDTFEYSFVLSKEAPKTFNALMEPNNLAGTTNKSSTSRQQNGVVKPIKDIQIRQMRPLTNVWRLGVGYMKTTRDLIAFEHPAMFPEQLAERHIYTWSNPDDIVLDYFMGSGTTAKIARNLGRKYIGCDLSPEYVALAQTRLQNTDPFQDTVLPDGTKQLSLFSMEGIA